MSNVVLDCQDNSCLFSKEKKGMRTNAGCRCISNMAPELNSDGSNILALKNMFPRYLAMRDTLKEFEQSVGFASPWHIKITKALGTYEETFKDYLEKEIEVNNEH